MNKRPFTYLLLCLLACLALPLHAQTSPAATRATAERVYNEALTRQAQKTAQAKQEAIALFQTALAHWRAAGDQPGEARTLYNLGATLLGQGEKPAALRHLNAALQLWRALGERAWEAATRNTLGNAYLSQGETQQALDAYHAALAFYRPLKQLRGEAQVLSNLGLVYRALGQPALAATHYRQALALNRALGERRLEAVTLHNLAEVYLQQRAYRRAVEYCELALPLHKATADHIGTGHTLEHLGTAWFWLGQPQRALAHYQAALALVRRLGARQLEARTLNDLGTVYAKLGEPQRALECYEQALALARAVAHRGGEAHTLAGLARLARERGQWAAARAHIEAALQIVQVLRTRVDSRELRATYFATQRDFYEFYLDLLGRLHEREPQAGHAARAFDASEQARARSLLDLLAQPLETALEAEPLGAAALQAQLEPDTALLEYVLGREGSFLFVVTRDALHSYRLPPQATLEPLVQTLRAALGRPSRGAFGRYVNAAQQLYALLLAPAETVLRNYPRWLIAPDAALYHLPFEALLTSAAAQPQAAYQTLPYLLRQRTLSYIPSASVLASLRQRAVPAPGGPAFMAFADPAYETNSGLARLAQAQREVSAIARLFPANAVQLFAQAEASETAVKTLSALRRAQHLHFATHGRMNESQPQASGLLLARAPTDDGLLQISEVLALQLQAELVVLSACETGLGKTLSGEGVLGLTRAFLAAGARSVAVSLWQVADDSTAELMIEFYQQANSSADRAAALREAKLKLLAQRRYAHPYYWAPFVLSGAPR